jgi:hypothetical protein
MISGQPLRHSTRATYTNRSPRSVSTMHVGDEHGYATIEHVTRARVMAQELNGAPPLTTGA